MLRYLHLVLETAQPFLCTINPESVQSVMTYLTQVGARP